MTLVRLVLLAVAAAPALFLGGYGVLLLAGSNYDGGAHLVGGMLLLGAILPLCALLLLWYGGPR